ncbi:MAG: acyltransferase [Acidobacteriaceae bacterium]|nr:acyltransferase [Acidobacteriaceae bacterium]
MTELAVTDIRNPEPAPRQPRPPQLPALTSVRFFAALYVALFHMVRPFERWGRGAEFAGAGYVGVSFFFLLSGFILTYSHAAEPSLGSVFRKRFYFARFARIYPVYFLLTLAAGVLMRSYFDKPIHLVAYLADFLMLQTWSIRMVSFFNVPAWSVSMEVFFYLVFPFLFRRVRPRSLTAGVALLLGFWLLAMAMPAVAMATGAGGTWHEGFGSFSFWIRRFPPFALPEFLAGVVLGWLYLEHPPAPRRALWMAITAILTLLALLSYADHLPMLMLHNGLLIPLYALVLVGLSQRHWLSRALAWGPLVLLGEASYSLYLTHFMLGDAMTEYFGWQQNFRALAVNLPLALAISVLLYLCVERPSRKRLLRWWNGRHARA